MPQRYFGAWGYPSANDACTISTISSGGLAQLVELLPRKQRVNGSIPLTSTIEITKKLRMQLFAFLGPAFWLNSALLSDRRPRASCSPHFHLAPILLALAKAGFFAHNKAISWPKLGRAD